MSVCIHSVFVVFLRRADPTSKEPYRLFIGSRNWERWPRPNKRL
jgi:hypothetical protein